jgi:hypothetical protein
LRLTKLISGEISTSNHSLYFVAVNWLHITGGHAVIVLDTQSNLQLMHALLQKNISGVTLSWTVMDV